MVGPASAGPRASYPSGGAGATSRGEARRFSTTAFDDGARDVLTGGPNADWFVSGAPDGLDRESTELKLLVP
jgi:hypothetical protein